MNMFKWTLSEGSRDSLVRHANNKVIIFFINWRTSKLLGRREQDCNMLERPSQNNIEPILPEDKKQAKQELHADNINKLFSFAQYMYR